MLYLVTWTIHLDADSHQEAAQKARAIQQSTDPANIAHVYQVQERPDVLSPSSPMPPVVNVDLDEQEGKV